MPRRTSAASPFALFCRTLRSARGLSQEELAAGAGVHVASIKNAEGDEPVAISTVGTIYRTGLTGKNALSSEEWHQLVAYWLARQLPANSISIADLSATLRQTGTARKSKSIDRASALARAIDSLDPAQADVFDHLAAIARKKSAPHVFAAIRAILDLA
jgi:transcriptional regulator with XRE-family HTH domain